MTIVYRLVKGSNLTPAEFDGNFHDIDDRVVALEGAQPQPDDIASIDLTGNKLTLTLVSGATLGPVFLPVLKWRWRADWTAFAIYATLDVFVVATGADAGVYVARLDHTAAATFDPDAVGAAVQAGSLDTGVTYVIANVADTDFTLIGASANTVGIEFVATGAGSGSGTATPKLYDRIIATLDLATHELADHADVDAASPTAGDFLTWDDASPGTWVNTSDAAATALLVNFVGDSGSGGTKGLVPAPAAGDAAASKFLAASGGWSTIPAGVTTLDGLDDVVLTAPDASQFLVSGDSSPASWTNKTATEVTALLDAFTGDDATPAAGGVKGLVPAPASGDGAAAKYLDAQGGWSRPLGMQILVTGNLIFGMPEPVVSAASDYLYAPL